MTFKESIQLDGQQSGGKTIALLVEKVEPTGPAATYFGLKRGDLITDVGYLKVKDNMTGGDDGIDFLMDAYSKKQSIVVLRDEVAITLPGGTPVAGANQPQAQPQAQPQQPAPQAPPKDDRGSLQRQLDNITGAGQNAGKPG
jgi:hypothetical protein